MMLLSIFYLLLFAQIFTSSETYTIFMHAHFVWPPTTMTSSKQDTAASGADAAGGEAIYSSDGLPPLPAPVPPIKSRQDVPASGETDGDAILDSESMSLTDAFEVFGGRAYLRPAGGSRRSNGAAAATAAGNLVAGSAAGGAATGLAVEPPLVRLARLSAELTELERDLASSATGGAGAGPSAAGVSNEELTKLARELSSRLEVMSNQHGIAPGAGGSGRALSDNLTRLVREELTKMEQTSAAASSDAASASESGGSGGGGIVYELYASSSTGHVGPTSAASAASEASIEERLGRIERAVGSSTAGGTGASQSSLAAAVAAGVSGGGATSGRTVLERLEEAEKMAGRVDAKALDAAAARAKVIR